MKVIPPRFFVRVISIVLAILHSSKTKTTTYALSAASPQSGSDPMFRSSASKQFQVRIVSYNVLSSHLASESHYPTLKPEHLKAENRLPVVLQKLENEITQHPHCVLCLQEVSYDWSGALQTFFANRGFHVATGLYGKPFNGYMGVLLAFPTSAYQVLDVNIARLADQRSEGWPEEPSVNVWQQIWGGVTSFVGGLLPKDPNGEETPPDHWTLSKRRFNVLVSTALKDKESGQVFCVGTYHMPCAYYCPMAMTIHADLAARHVQSFASKHGDAPFVLAGDFNIKPSEPVYEFLTTGKLDSGSPFYPSPKSGMEWTPTLEGSLTSAYAAALGKEPDFTNYAQSRDSDPFIETLDYIFCSPDIKVERVLEIADRTNAQGPFPNLDVNEPSDHVLIAADLTTKPEF